MRRSRKNRMRVLAAALAASLLPLSSAFAAPDEPNGPKGEEGAWYEVFSQDGRITLERAKGGDTKPETRAVGDAKLTTFAANGPSVNRMDFVFEGDGYTKDQLPAFAQQTQAAWNALFSHEPLKTYAKFVNGHRIDIESSVSGISADGNRSNVKQTPLGMRFWCHGIERLLCVDTDKAEKYAKMAPAANKIITIANTSTYGGAGGGVTTATGSNQFSNQVLVHEMGHSLGALGDEYDTPFGSGGGEEPAFPNVTAFTEQQMRERNTKWTKWLGADSVDNAKIGVHQGANYYTSGFYRPTPDSVMRTLGKEFNNVSIEALIKGIYNIVRPIDGSTYEPRGYLLPDQQVSTSVQSLPNGQMQVYWALNGQAIPGTVGKLQINLKDYANLIKKGQYNSLSVTARDTTPWVKDEEFRNAKMTQTDSWWVWGG
ncbi:M64 family metallopeptidase [Yinghuangia soli]|uniref:M64 family metallopeptidase n=1 Tax=Yinghuangia soli TaxID=2908204 RepID=A0AA41U1X9_9ACTN|nr:M64 family metallopeptidase [Yinghuangia soli]MCF2526544.1 M64 family metallopeptidase [Yinghuangia soli]